MELLYERMTSFAGGENDSAPATSFKPDEATVIQNGRIGYEGYVEVRKGSQRIHATALNSGAQCYGITTFITAAGVEQWVAFFGTAGYYSTDDGVNWTAITGATGLREDYWDFATIRVSTTNYLIGANGNTNTYKYDGTTWGTVANIPNGVKYVETFNDRLYASGQAGSTVVASKIGDFETWTTPDGLSLQVQTHDGDNDVRALYQHATVLLAFKRNSVSYIDGYGNSDIIVAAGARGLSRSVGCVGFRTIRAVGSSIMWLSDRGVEMYTPGAEIRLASDKIKTFMSRIAWENIVATPGIPCALFYPARHEYWVAVPVGGTQSNYIAVFNLISGGWARWTFGETSGDTLYVDDDGYLNYNDGADRSKANISGGYLGLAAEGLWVSKDADGYLQLEVVASDVAALMIADHGDVNQAPVAGCFDGFVRYLDSGAQDNLDSNGANGEDISFTLRTRPLLFGDPFRRKRVRAVRVSAIAEASASVTVLTLPDGADGATHTLTIDGATKGQPRQAKARTNARGRSIPIEIRASTAGLKISGIEVGAELMRESA